MTPASLEKRLSRSACVSKGLVRKVREHGFALRGEAMPRQALNRRSESGFKGGLK
jgi:hypothetical protein